MNDIYVKDGTPVGNDFLCRTCAWARVTTGYRASEMLIICTDVSPNLYLPFRVRECNGYLNRSRPTWQQMQKLAIHIDAHKTLKSVGFGITADTAADDAEEE